MIECTICLENVANINDYKNTTQLNCKHIFHKPCLDGWICASKFARKEKNLDGDDFSCPNCRARVFIYNHDTHRFSMFMMSPESLVNIVIFYTACLILWFFFYFFWKMR